MNSNLLKGLVPVYTLAEKRLICAAQSIALWLYLLLILGDLSVLDLPWNLAIEGIQECVLKTRDIPRLTNPSPPAHQLGLQSPLSAMATTPNVYAGFSALLLLSQ